jgi:flagellar assembly protein FliH
MFSSSVIKGEALKRVEFATVNYDALAVPTGEVRSGTIEEGFVPMTFTGTQDAESSRLALEAANLEEPAGEQVTLSAGMVMIDQDDLQQRLDAQYRSGQEEGRELAERGLGNVFKALRQSVADLDGLRDKVFRESEEDLLKLSIMIARKIIQQELSLQPQILAKIVAATIADCSELDRINIRLNPADYAVVAADRHGFLGNLCPDVHVSLATDDTISQGGCIVDTTTGTVDARIETQLDEIFRRFMEDRTLSSGDSEGDEVSQNVDKG